MTQQGIMPHVPYKRALDERVIVHMPSFKNADYYWYLQELDKEADRIGWLLNHYGSIRRSKSSLAQPVDPLYMIVFLWHRFTIDIGHYFLSLTGVGEFDLDRDDIDERKHQLDGLVGPNKWTNFEIPVDDRTRNGTFDLFAPISLTKAAFAIFKLIDWRRAA